MTSKLGLLPALLPDDKTDEDLKLDKGFEWGAKDITGTVLLSPDINGCYFMLCVLLQSDGLELLDHFSTCIKSARFS